MARYFFALATPPSRGFILGLVVLFVSTATTAAHGGLFIADISAGGIAAYTGGDASQSNSATNAGVFLFGGTATQFTLGDGTSTTIGNIGFASNFMLAASVDRNGNLVSGSGTVGGLNMNSFSISGTLDDSATENDLLLSGSLTSLQVTRTTTKDAAVFKFDAIVDRSADGGILADTFGDTIQLTIGIANLPDPLSNFSFTPATANATRPVPEPASLFMFSGLLGCMVRFRKKNRRGSVLS